MKVFFSLCVAAFIGLNFSGCFSADNNSPANPSIEPEPVEVIETSPPVTETVPVPAKEEGVFDWYQQPLERMEEGPLKYSEPDNGLRFRFLWLRRFHKAYVVRGFEGVDGKIKLHLKGLSGQGGFDEAAKKVDDTFVHLTQSQSTEILAWLDQLKLCQDHPQTMVNSVDGAMWVFEQQSGDDYCYRQFHSSNNGSDLQSYKDFGLHLLKTTRVKTWEIDVY